MSENINGMAVERGEAPDKRAKKSGTLVSAFIEQTAYEALLRHCDITGQSKTKAIERAILNYCKDGLEAAGSADGDESG